RRADYEGLSATALAGGAGVRLPAVTFAGAGAAFPADGAGFPAAGTGFRVAAGSCFAAVGAAFPDAGAVFRAVGVVLPAEGESCFAAARAASRVAAESPLTGAVAAECFVAAESFFGARRDVSTRATALPLSATASPAVALAETVSPRERTMR